MHVVQEIHTKQNKTNTLYAWSTVYALVIDVARVSYILAGMYVN